MAFSYDPEKGRISSYDSRHNFSTSVQNHLKRVYWTLCCTLLAAAFGAYLHMLWNIGGFVTTLGCAGSGIWLYHTAPYQHSSKRLYLLFLAALLKGASDGPILKLAIDLDSSFLITAFVGVALAFVCFYAVAMLARRREYLYIGGALSSVISISVWLPFAFFWFSRSSASVSSYLQLYVLLLIFVAYIVVDTRKIIEKARRGDLDYVKHSLSFFTAVFARILNIMMKNFAYKQEEERGDEEIEFDKYV